MRDPARVIADALYRLGLDQGNDATNGAVDVILALRDEYGTALATTAPDPMSAGMVIRCIPVPAEEGTDG